MIDPMTPATIRALVEQYADMLCYPPSDHGLIVAAADENQKTLLCLCHALAAQIAQDTQEACAQIAETMPHPYVDPRFNPLGEHFNAHGHPVEEETKRRIAAAIRQRRPGSE